MKKLMLVMFALSMGLLAQSAFGQGEPIYRFNCYNPNTDTIYKLNVQSESEVYYEAGNTNIGYFEAGVYAERADSSSEKILFQGTADNSGHEVGVDPVMLEGYDGDIQISGASDYQTGTYHCDVQHE